MRTAAPSDSSKAVTCHCAKQCSSEYPAPAMQKGCPSSKSALGREVGSVQKCHSAIKAKRRQKLTGHLAPVRKHCLTKSSLPWIKRDGSSGSCVPEGCKHAGRAPQHWDDLTAHYSTQYRHGEQRCSSVKTALIILRDEWMAPNQHHAY